MDIKTLIALNGGDVPKALLAYKAMNHTEAQTDHASGTIATFEAERSARIKSLTVTLSPIQAGSGDPSPSNIRPISGWTKVNVWRSGVNMFVLPDGMKSVAGVDYTYDSATNTLTKAGTSADVAGLNLGSIYLPSGTYTFSADFSGETGKSTKIHLRDAATNTNVGNISKSSPSLTVELSGTYYFRVATNGGLTGGVISNFQLERSDTGTDYTANKCEAYSVTFPSDPGTVYGGTLDVVSGVLTVDRAVEIIDGSQSLSLNGLMPYGGAQVIFIPSVDKRPASTQQTQNEGLLSDKFSTTDPAPTLPYCLTGRATNGKLYINMPSEITTAADAQTWFENNQTQVSFLLATPLTFNLSPAQIKTLVGTNNIWSDAGDVDVTYYT